MLANVNRNLLLYSLIAIIIVAGLFVIGGTIWAILKSYKKGNYSKLRIIITSIFCIFIAGFSWVLNMGWIRFIMTIMLIPFIHAIIFFLINILVSAYINKSKKLRIYNIIFCMTYLTFYLLLPDGGDVGGMYVFFGLIHSDWFSYVCNVISSLAALVHIVLFILQIIALVKVKKSILIEKES